MQIINNKMAKGNKKERGTYIRIDKELLNKLARLKLPIQTKHGHIKESYSDVIHRLLIDPKIRAKMERDQQEAWK